MKNKASDFLESGLLIWRSQVMNWREYLWFAFASWMKGCPIWSNIQPQLCVELEVPTVATCTLRFPLHRRLRTCYVRDLRVAQNFAAFLDLTRASITALSSSSLPNSSREQELNLTRLVKCPNQEWKSLGQSMQKKSLALHILRYLKPHTLFVKGLY
jgi:hypothetical protein